jgi:hypothetical protein
MRLSAILQEAMLRELADRDPAAASRSTEGCAVVIYGESLCGRVSIAEGCVPLLLSHSG